MGISVEHRRLIEKIMSQTSCRKNFACYKTDFKNLCEAKVIAFGKLVECGKPKGDCMNNPDKSCEFRLPFGNSNLCYCPLRSYAAQKMGK